MWHSPKGLPMISNHTKTLVCDPILWILFPTSLGHSHFIGMGRRYDQLPREDKASAQFLFRDQPFSVSGQGSLWSPLVPLNDFNHLAPPHRHFHRGPNLTFGNMHWVVTSFPFTFPLKIRTPIWLFLWTQSLW